MKNNLTELVFILDRSGSMSGLECDTIGGFNSLIEKQRLVSGEARVTTVLFDDQYLLLGDNVNLTDIQPMCRDQYFVRGSTALVDAIGKTISDIGARLAITQESERPEKVIFVIMTDGMENASREFSADRVRSMVEHQKTKYSWEFIFMGANIDAVNVASSYGISSDRAVKFSADSVGVQLNYSAAAEVMSCMRMNQELAHDWKSEIESNLNSKSSDGKESSESENLLYNRHPRASKYARTMQTTAADNIRSREANVGIMPLVYIIEEKEEKQIVAIEVQECRVN